MIKIIISFISIFLISNAIAQNVAPVLQATGNQIYCPQTSLPIVTDMSIIDPDDVGISAMYIQISSGYVFGQDVLTLTGVHPSISASWNAIEGKLSSRSYMAKDGTKKYSTDIVVSGFVILEQKK